MIRRQSVINQSEDRCDQHPSDRNRFVFVFGDGFFFVCFFFKSTQTVLSYRPGTSSLNSYLRHLSGSHIAGPALLVIGLILLAAGLALHTVARRLQQTEPSAAEEGENHVKTTPPPKKTNKTNKHVSMCLSVVELDDVDVE